MSDSGASLGWGLVVGGSLLVGALTAVVVRLWPSVAASVSAFGGGLLMAAVALELVPGATQRAGRALTTVGFIRVRGRTS